jgi:DNA processing protein
LNLADLWHAELEEVASTGLDPVIADEFIRWRETIDAEKMLNKLEEEGITTVSIGQAAYPKLLAEINDPPHTLFIRGTLASLDRSPGVAVVGTRKASTYGKQVCERLSAELAQQGMCIVSGLALGIDGVAHQAALEQKAPTIAVLGSGVNQQNITPPVHHSLAERIIEHGGALISEYPPGFAPTAYSFPARNRIIAGLTLGTLVIEAPLQSGALITARAALDYNRDVFAVPHNLTNPNGEGCNKLIAQGALLVTSGEDIINALQLKHLSSPAPDKQRVLPDSPIEAAILQTLSHEPLHIDLIIKNTALESRAVNGSLVIMEMKGLVKNVGGMMYVAL